MIYIPVRERKSQARYITVTINTETLLILVLLHKKWGGKKGEQTKTERTCISKTEETGQWKAKPPVGQQQMSLLLQIKAKFHFNWCRVHLCLHRCFRVRAIKTCKLSQRRLPQHVFTLISKPIFAFYPLYNRHLHRCSVVCMCAHPNPCWVLAYLSFSSPVLSRLPVIFSLLLPCGAALRAPAAAMSCRRGCSPQVIG